MDIFLEYKFRLLDLRGGANGARLSLSPQNNWPANEPGFLKTILSINKVYRVFNSFYNLGLWVIIKNLVDSIIVSSISSSSSTISIISVL